MQVNQTLTNTRTITKSKYQDAPGITIIEGSNGTAVLIMIIAATVLLIIGLVLIGRYVYNKTRQQHVAQEYIENANAAIAKAGKTIPHQQYASNKSQVGMVGPERELDEMGNKVDK